MDDRVWIQLSNDTVRQLPEELQTPAKSILLSSIRAPVRNDLHELILLDRDTGKGRSVKSLNAFLDIRKLLRTLCELTLEGYVAYQIPVLFLPAALKILLSARQLVEINLDKVHAVTILSIYRLQEETNVAPSLSSAFDLAQSLSNLRPFCQDLSEPEFRVALKELQEMKAITINDKGEIQLLDEVEILAMPNV